MIENSTVGYVVVSTRAKWYNGGPLCNRKQPVRWDAGTRRYIATGSFAKPESFPAEIETHVVILLSMSPNIFRPVLRSHGRPLQCALRVMPNLGDGEQSGSSAKAVIAVHSMRFAP
jgi:hypothetical protein